MEVFEAIIALKANEDPLLTLAWQLGHAYGNSTNSNSFILFRRASL